MTVNRQHAGCKPHIESITQQDTNSYVVFFGCIFFSYIYFKQYANMIFFRYSAFLVEGKYITNKSDALKLCFVSNFVDFYATGSYNLSMDAEYPQLLHWNIKDPYLNVIKPLKLDKLQKTWVQSNKCLISLISLCPMSVVLKKIAQNSRYGTSPVATIEDATSISILLITRLIRVGFVYNKCRERHGVKYILVYACFRRNR